MATYPSSPNSRPRYDININQNATFKMSIQVTNVSGSPIDINNWSFSGSIKQNYTDNDPPILFFSCSVLDFSQSLISFMLNPYQTEVLSQPSYYYDFIGTNYSTTPDEVYRLLEGKVRVHPGITDPSLTDLPNPSP